RRLPIGDAQLMLGSTHALPLPFLLSTVRDTVGEIVLIGIQPADRSLGEGLTPAVQVGAEGLVAHLREGRLTDIPPLASAEETPPHPAGGPSRGANQGPGSDREG
ncbi:MAG: hypothetical protein ABID40_01735, partial [Candidatus Bipolaricaulota bacterium]